MGSREDPTPHLYTPEIMIVDNPGAIREGEKKCSGKLCTVRRFPHCRQWKEGQPRTWMGSLYIPFYRDGVFNASQGYEGRGERRLVRRYIDP